MKKSVFLSLSLLFLVPSLAIANDESEELTGFNTVRKESFMDQGLYQYNSKENQSYKAKNGLFLGAEASKNINSFNYDDGEEFNLDNDSTSYQLSLGYKTKGDSNYFLFYKKERFDNGVYGVFLSDEEKNSKDLTSYGIGMRHDFPLWLNGKLAPYFKTTLSYGTLDIATGANSRTLTDSGEAKVIGVSAGLGLAYEVNRHFEFIAGVDMQYRYWESVVLNSSSANYFSVDELQVSEPTSYLFNTGVQFTF